MPEGLRLQIGAETKDAEQALKSFVTNLDKTGDAAEKLSDTFRKSFGAAPLNNIEKYSKAVLNLKNDLSSVKIAPLSPAFASSVSNANSQLQKLPNTSNAATLSLINLSRVAQDAPFGFLGIANNLNPLLESFQRLKKESGSTGGALKSLVGSLSGAGGIGLALSVVSSLLIVFGKNLFGAGEAADVSKAKLDSLSDTIKSVTENVDGLSASISFANQLGAINVDIRGEGDLQNLVEQSVAQRQLIFDIGQQVIQAQKNLDAARLADQEQASDESKKVADEALKVLQDTQKKETEARQQSTILFRQIALQKIKDEQEAQKKAEEAQKKALESLKKYIDDAKRLNSELEKIGFVAPADFSFFDTQEEQLKKAQKVFNDFNTRNLKIQSKVFTFPVEFSEPPPEKVKEAIGVVEDGIKKGILGQPPIEVPVTFTAQEERNADVIREFRKKFEAAGLRLQLPEGALQDPALFSKLNNQFDDLQKRIVIANDAANLLSNTFQGLFQRIAQGESPIKAFFQAIGQSIVQLITQLIAATLRAAIFKAILGGATGGISSIARSATEAIPGLAAGGIVSGPTLALVGEGVGTSRSNPEVIAPLDQLRGMLSDLGGGSQRIIVTGRLRGRDQVLQNARTSRSQRRLGAR